MRIAAIDIGTNSLHMIVASVRGNLSFDVIDREKEMVRLGAGSLGGGSLTRGVMQSALHVLSSFRRVAEARRVDEIVAVATSAVREAKNGGDFLRAVRRETGIRPRLISGTEEAALIYRAAAYGVGGSDASVVIDIGGGSVEIVRGVALQPETTRSFKLGVIRLTEAFVRSDPLSKGDERRLAAFVDREAGRYLDEIARRGFTRVVGTSGTILSLGAVAAAHEGARGAALRNWRMSAQQVTRVRKQFVSLPLDKRLQVPGLEPRRADLAVAGAVLLDTVLKRLGASEMTLCDLSLREGLVLDFINRHQREIAHIDQYPDPRRRSVLELAERCQYEPAHATQVARLALLLFDATRGAHQLSDREREWLEYAALLHDIGVHVSYERHHRHSYYLIKNGNLRGFEPDEIEAIALIARYHRKATPATGDEGLRNLDGAGRRAVRGLAAVLRLAESLDRSHAQLVTGFTLHDRSTYVLLALRTSGDTELEVWAAMRQRGPFERLVGKPVRIKAC